MKRGYLLVALMFSTAAGCSSGPAKDAGSGDPSKGTVVEFDNLKSTAPDTWKEEKPNSSFRLTQFRLPRAAGDGADAELAIFKNIGGSAQANVDRWKGQFVPPEGKVQELKIAGCKALYLDIAGTFLDGRPGAPGDQAQKRANYRMLAVHFEGPRTIYHIKLTGPEKTIASHKKAFDEWLRGFKN
jgi:hypothetical protein